MLSRCISRLTTLLNSTAMDPAVHPLSSLSESPRGTSDSRERAEPRLSLSHTSLSKFVAAPLFLFLRPKPLGLLFVLLEISLSPCIKPRTSLAGFIFQVYPAWTTSHYLHEHGPWSRGPPSLTWIITVVSYLVSFGSLDEFQSSFCKLGC